MRHVSQLQGMAAAAALVAARAARPPRHALRLARGAAPDIQQHVYVSLVPAAPGRPCVRAALAVQLLTAGPPG